MKYFFDIEVTTRKDEKGEIISSIVTDRIICISVLNAETKRVNSFIDIDEAEILKRFWEFVKEGDTLIGWNSGEFDCPWIIRRSIVNNVKIKNFKHLDLRLYSHGFFISYKKGVEGTLDYFGQLMGYDPKPEDGPLLTTYFTNMQYNKILEHCEYDCLLTSALYDRMKNCGVIND